MFAGHPTVGTAWVLRDVGKIAKDRRRFVLDENVGPVDIRVDDEELIWLRTPPIRTSRGSYDPALCAAAIGLEPGDLLGNGPCQNVLRPGIPRSSFRCAIASASTEPRLTRSRCARLLGQTNRSRRVIFVFTPAEEGAYSRMFANDFGIVEDPATGSADRAAAAVS